MWPISAPAAAPGDRVSLKEKYRRPVRSDAGRAGDRGCASTAGTRARTAHCSLALVLAEFRVPSNAHSSWLLPLPANTPPLAEPAPLFFRPSQIFSFCLPNPFPFYPSCTGYDESAQAQPGKAKKASKDGKMVVCEAALQSDGFVCKRFSHQEAAQHRQLKR